MSKAVDYNIRNEATHDLHTSFFLEAGAGTGKTRILIDRTVEIIRTGEAELQQIVIITFTEKAATELRSRLRERLHDELFTGNITERTRCKDAIASLASAHIDTIHAFSSSLLREFPIDTGIDPGFEQLDAMASEIDFQKQWENWIWNIKDNQLLAIEQCLRLGLSLSTVRTIASILDSNRDLSPSTISIHSNDLNEFLEMLIKILENAEILSKSCLQRTDDCLKKYQELTDICSAVVEINESTDNSENASIITALINSLSFRFRRNYGSRNNWQTPQDLEKMRNLLRSADKYLSQFQSKQNQISLHQLAKELAKFVKSAASSRQRRGKLNFDDLLIEAQRLILENRSVRKILQTRYRFILVDEFQDTDPLQAELIFLLASDGSLMETSLPNWQDVTLVKGKLFLVGDPKQSIYRFRRADIDTYLAAKQIFNRQPPGNAQIKTISQNFRSVPAIVSWVNHTFNQAFEPDLDFPGAQPEYRPIHPYRNKSYTPGVFLLYSTTGVWDIKLPQLRNEEANAIARLVTNIVDNQKWKILGKLDKERPISFRDICILVESRTAIEAYTRELIRHNVPHIVDGGRDLFRRQEVRELLSILRCIDDPSDEPALIAALKSTAFSCSDSDLLEFQTSGQNFNILSAKFPKTIVGNAMSTLFSLYNQKHRISLPLLIDKIVREQFLLEPLLATKSERQHAMNLKRIVERAIQFSENESNNLRPFVRWLNQQQVDSHSQTDFHLTETDDDVVKLMTIHGAKGLEFPVVILAKLSGGTSADRSQSVVDRTRSVIDFAVGNRMNRFETAGFLKAAVREKSYSKAEAARLMYVACTRACELLIVSVYKSESRPGMFQHLPGLPSWKEVVDDGLRKTQSGALVILDESLPKHTITQDKCSAFPEDILSQWEMRKATIRSKLRRGPLYTSPSEINSTDPRLTALLTPLNDPSSIEEDSVYMENQSINGDKPQSIIENYNTKSMALRRGILVHEVLCRCELSDPDSAILLTKQLTVKHDMPEILDDITNHVLKIINSSSINRVLNSKNVLREVPLTWYNSNKDKYVEGFLDLAFEEKDGWVLVDYKTDFLVSQQPLAVKTLLSRYHSQLLEYRNAAQTAGMRVKACGVWLTSTGNLYLW